MKINSIFTFLIFIIYSSQSFSSYWEGIVNGSDVEINENGIKKNGTDIPQFKLSDIELCAYGNKNFPNFPLDYNIKDFMDDKRVYSWDNPGRWGSGGKWSMEFTRRPSINYGLDCKFRWEYFIKNNKVSDKFSDEKSTNTDKLVISQQRKIPHICKDFRYGFFDDRKRKVEQSTDQQICWYASNEDGWDDSGLFCHYVKEAFKRKLDCSGLSAQEIEKKRIDYSKHKKLNQDRTSNNKISDTFKLAQNKPGLSSSYIESLGILISNTTNREGVYIKDIDMGSNSYKKGIRRGNIIYRIGANEVNNVEDFLKFISSTNKPDILILANKRFYVVNLNKDFLLSLNDKSICNKAIFNGKWETDPDYKEYVNEAKRRGLTCSKDSQEKKNRKLKLELEKERKLAEERARKKKLADEKTRKKKEAAEKARKKKLAEQERKRKLEQDKIAKKIKAYKRQAANFYKDVEEFVKSGGKIDLVKLSDFFDIKPDPKKNWNSSDLKAYQNLRQFMNSVSEFVTYEKQMIGERLKKSFALKDQSIAKLEKNLDDLKGLMRKMFGSSDMPKIKKMIKEIEANLANFNQSKANKLIVQTTNYISSKLDTPKVVETNKQTKVVKKASLDQSWLEFQSKLTPQQEQFCKLTESFYKDLNKARKAKNEIMVNRVHKERQINLDGLIPNGKINNWIFRILKVDQVDNGSAAFVLSLQCNSYVGSGQIHTKSTWRKKSNKEWRATVPYNSRRFNELGKLAAGEFVLASGTLLEVNAFKPGQIETFYASQQIGEHPLTKDLNLEGELFLADLSYIAALN